MVNKDIIVDRSKIYGNNFPFLAKIWMNYFKIKYGVNVQISAEDAAMMMCLHKISRLANNPEDKDTLQDMINYAWLGISYSQYESLLKTESYQNVEENDYHCYKYKCKCIYHDDDQSKLVCADCNNYDDCDWNTPILIN